MAIFPESEFARKMDAAILAGKREREHDLYFAEEPLTDEQIEQFAQIIEYADRIAIAVREKGVERFGHMWAEGYTTLEDGRSVHCQESEEDDPRFDALILNVTGTPDHPGSVHLRYDLGHDEIWTYEEMDPEGNMQLSFQMPKRTDYWNMRLPPDLALGDIIDPVFRLMQQVETAMERQFTWEPERQSIPVIAPTPFVPELEPTL